MDDKPRYKFESLRLETERGIISNGVKESADADFRDIPTYGS